MQNEKKGLIIIGAAGQQGQEYLGIMHHLKDLVDLRAVVDLRTNELARIATHYNVPFFKSADHAMAKTDFDLALITVPHHGHYENTIAMLNNNKHVIKEKPFAITYERATNLINSAKENNVQLFTVVQRSHRQMFNLIQDKLPLIGEPYSFHYEYYKNFKSITPGWRSNHSLSSGGVVLDMGFHIIDMILRLFGSPTNIEAQFSYCYPHTLKERLEDSANIIFSYPHKNLIGNISLARHHYIKQEQLEILGTTGAIVVTPQHLKIFGRSGELIEDITCQESKLDGVINMFQHYLTNIENKNYFEQENYIQLNNVRLIEQIYQNK